MPDPCALCDKVQSEEWKTPKVRKDVHSLVSLVRHILTYVQVYNHMYDWFIMGSRCIFTK